MSSLIGDAVVRVRADASGFGKEASSGIKDQVKTLAKLAGGAVAVGGAADFLKDAIGNAVTFQEQVAGLDQTLQNVGQGTDKARKTADNYTEALSKLSGFARVDVASSLQKATQGTGNLGKAMQVETTAANLARSRHIDLASATLLVTKAYDGNTTSLKRLGINFTPVTTAQDALVASMTKGSKQAQDLQAKIHVLDVANQTATKSEKAANTVKIDALKNQIYQIAQTTKGSKAQLDAAKASDKANTSLKVQSTLTKLTAGGMTTFAGTTAGALAHVRNEVDEVQTKIGLALLPTIKKLADLGAKYISELDEDWPKISKAVSDETTKIEAALKPVWNTIESLKGPIEDVVNYFGGATTVVKDLAIAIVAFVAVTKTVAVAVAIYEDLQTVIYLVRNAQLLLDAAMEANPVGIITVAILALSAALYETYEHSATFRNVVNSAFGDVKTYVLPILKDIEQAIASFVTWIRDHWTQISAIIGPIAKAAFALLKGYVEAPLDEIKAAINLFGDVIHGRWSNIWGDLKQLVLAPLADVKTAVTGALTNLGPLAETAAQKIGHLIVTGVQAGVAALPGLASKLASLVGSLISKAAQGVFNEAKRVGSLIIDGIGQGIENGAGDLAGVAGSVAKKALSAATGGLVSAYVQTGGTLIGAVEAQTNALGPALERSLVSQITSATASAKQNLTSLTGTLSSDIGSVIDAATTKQVNLIATNLASTIAGIPDQLTATIGGVNAGTSTSDAAAKIAKDNAAKQQRSLQAALDDANAAAAAGPAATTTVNGKTVAVDPATLAAQQATLVQAQKDAQTDLDDFLLQQQIDTDNASYQAAVTAAQAKAALDTQSAQDAATTAKQTVDNQIDLYTQQFNAGKLTQSQYLADITAEINTYASGDGTTAFTNAGDLLGQAWANAFKAAIADVTQQVQAIASAGPGGTGGNGLGGTVDQPGDAIAAQFVTATSTVGSDNTALAKAQAAVAAATKKDTTANAFKLNNFGVPVLINGTVAQARAADAALKAAQAQLEAAQTSQAKDAAILAALRILLQKAGQDPNAVLAAAAR